MHGVSGHTVNRLYTEEVLPVLGHNLCQTWHEVQETLDTRNFAYLSLDAYCPPLAEMIQLRNVLGLRSPVHTLSRLINPLNAQCSLQAIFHPAYRESHQKAAQLLNYQNTMVIKGEGGEFERNPDGRCLVKGIQDGELYDLPHQYGEAAVIGTLALALMGLKKATDPEAALTLAQRWWKHRKAAKKAQSGEQIDLFDL